MNKEQYLQIREEIETEITLLKRKLIAMDMVYIQQSCKHKIGDVFQITDESFVEISWVHVVNGNFEFGISPSDKYLDEEMDEFYDTYLTHGRIIDEKFLDNLTKI